MHHGLKTNNLIANGVITDWFNSVFNKTKDAILDVVGFVEGIWDFLKTIFDGTFFVALWEGLIWPFIEMVLETFFLGALILPLTLVNLVNELVDVFSGLSTVSDGSGAQTTLLEYFFYQPSITRVFWGITLISAALCLGFSIVAVLRSMGDSQQNRPVGKVIGSVGKAMLTFLLVPFMCISAIMLSTVVMKQVVVLFDSSNEYGEEVKMEGALFLSAVQPKDMEPRLYDEVIFVRRVPGGVPTKLENVLIYTRTSSMEELFEKYDYEYWKSQYILVENPTPEQRNAAYNQFREDVLLGRRGVDFTDIPKLRDDLDVLGMVFYGPAFFTFLASWFVVLMLLMIVLAFIRRIFEVIMLYLVSPIFVSTIPLDDGKRFSGWRDMFISRLISGFGSIFTLKLFLLFLPVIWSPALRFSSSDFIDSFFKVIIMAGGMYSVYKSHTLISTLVNPQGAAAEQESSLAMVAVGGMAMAGVGSMFTGGQGFAAGSGMSGSSSSGGSSSGGSGNSNPALSRG